MNQWYDIDSCHCWARPIFQECPIVVWLKSGVFRTGNTLISIETVLINNNIWQTFVGGMYIFRPYSAVSYLSFHSSAPSHISILVQALHLDDVVIFAKLFSSWTFLNYCQLATQQAINTFDGMIQDVNIIEGLPTLWMLWQKCVVCPKSDIYDFNFYFIYKIK